MSVPRRKSISTRLKVEFTKEYILSIPKTINKNGCWIPDNIKVNSNGYCRVTSNYQQYFLHRLVLSIYHNLDYFNQSWDARHGNKCDRACFSYEHLQSGTSSDNSKDTILYGNNLNANKEICPKCGCKYRIMTIESGWNKGRTFRVCDACVAENGKSRDAREREKTRLKKEIKINESL